MAKPKFKKASAVSAREAAQGTKSSPETTGASVRDTPPTAMVEPEVEPRQREMTAEAFLLSVAARTSNPSHANGDEAAQGPADGKRFSAVELTERIKDLVRLAQEQGHLTYSDVNDLLPENVVTPEQLEEVFAKLRSLELEIVDQ